MPSLVWERLPQEAYDNPYEYAVQDQFVREATLWLSEIRTLLNKSNLLFHINDNSLEKATWMLAQDLVDSLMEVKILIGEKRHRVASRIFRDCVETIDLLHFLHSPSNEKTQTLESWYGNQTVKHGELRKHIEIAEGTVAAKKRRAFYDELSKFTHRTYMSLLHSYSLGRESLMVNDTYSETGMLVLPHVVATYLVVLASLIKEASQVLVISGAITADEMDIVWKCALDTHTVPRRFSISYRVAP